MDKATPEDLFNLGWRRIATIQSPQWLSPDGTKIYAEQTALEELDARRNSADRQSAKSWWRRSGSETA
jgi:hypothetical protein